MRINIELEFSPNSISIKEKNLTFEKPLSIRELITHINLSPNGLIATINDKIVPNHYIIDSDIKIKFIKAFQGG